ncbi:thiol-activated cytolysin family protein [Streptomyces klenkii]|uniref:thiol-activated cytolysin family protein n=1 Tax=Streptomyces klenkii TaxID=1420899 RepID=UPI00131A329D|nr:thiol-activated cytolysin family protein [Streptomyces klenkii]
MTAAALFAVPCAAAEPPDNAKEINAYFKTLKTWNEFASPKPNRNESIGKPTWVTRKGDDGKEVICLADKRSVTMSPTQLVTMNDTTHLWPGEFLQGKAYKNGHLSELAIDGEDRAPAKISLHLSSGGANRTVSKPDRGTVDTAVSEMMKERADGKPINKIDYRKTDGYKDTQVALEMNTSAKFMGLGKADFSLAAKHSATKNSVTAMFRQIAFTVDYSRPTTPAKFFSKTFTKDDLKHKQESDEIGPDNVPAYVSSVTYGRILIFTATSTATQSDLNASVDASLDVGPISASAKHKVDYKKVMKEADIKVKSLGGAAESAEDLIKTGKLDEFFKKAPTLAEYAPISYKLTSVKDNKPAVLSETAEFEEQHCNLYKGQFRVAVKSVKVLKMPDAKGQEVYGRVRMRHYPSGNPEKVVFERTKNQPVNVKPGSTLQLKEGYVDSEFNFANAKGKKKNELLPETVGLDVELTTADGKPFASIHTYAEPEVGDLLKKGEVLEKEAEDIDSRVKMTYEVARID